MRDIGIQVKSSQQGTELTTDEQAEVTQRIRDTPPNSYLRCPRSVTDALEGSTAQAPDSTVKSTIVQRLKDGFTLVRYRVPSGEETTGLFRGALLPVRPRSMPQKWPFSSNNGQDYQIFDKTLGIMNIAYSSAWQLGRVSLACSLATPYY
jgi:hypothetical protein